MAKKSISLRMDEEKIKKLDAIAYSQDRSRSYIIEEAVEAYVSYKDEKEATPSRELVIPRTNYIVIYRVMETELEILSPQIELSGQRVCQIT